MRRTVAINNKKPFGIVSEGFRLTMENFFAKVVTKTDSRRIRGRKEKQSRKGQAE